MKIIENLKCAFLPKHHPYSYKNSLIFILLFLEIATDCPQLDTVKIDVQFQFQSEIECVKLISSSKECAPGIAKRLNMSKNRQIVSSYLYSKFDKVNIVTPF